MDSYIPVEDQHTVRYKSRSRTSNNDELTSTTTSSIARTLRPFEYHSRDQTSHLTSNVSLVQRCLPPSSALSLSHGLQSSAPFSATAQDDVDWTFGQSKDIEHRSTLFHQTNSNINIRYTSARSSPQPSGSAKMSTIAIQQYDPYFDAGMPVMRPSYTWPNFDMSINQHYFSPVSSSVLNGPITHFEEPETLSVYLRAGSKSPPGGSLTPEQREMKRQRDLARRDSKTRYRRERSSSNSYTVSQQASPSIIPSNLSGYTTSLSPSPLLSHISPAMPSPAVTGPFLDQVTGCVESNLYAPVSLVIPNSFNPIPYNGDYVAQLASSQPQSIIQNDPAYSIDRQLYSTTQPLPITGESENGDHIRVVGNRPKPQCWDHGCNGRRFSTFSNLLRHQREKSGVAAKSSCPNCGAEFTRTTARNGHMAHEKCKQRKSSC